MNSQEEIKLEMSVGHFLCNRHGEPFRTRWPLGYITFSTELLRLSVQVPKLVKATRGNITRLPSVIETTRRALCCWVPASMLLEVYRQSNVGVNGRCDVCGQSRLGTAQLLLSAVGRERLVDHICFQCVCSLEPYKLETKI